MHGIGLRETGGPPRAMAYGSQEARHGSMNARHKMRLAIGFFSGAAGLSRALEELISTGITATRINLLSTLDDILPNPIVPDADCPISAPPATFVRAFAESDNAAQPTYERTMEFLAGIASEFVSDRSGSVPSVALQCHADPDVARDSFAGRNSLNRQVKRLRDHLLAGGTVLVIRLLTPDEHQQVCTTLLQHSGNDVQTHELSIEA